jgi:hypothetical protein
MELLPIAGLFAIVGLTAIADLVAQHVWVAVIAAGVGYLALVRGEIRTGTGVK